MPVVQWDDLTGAEQEAFELVAYGNCEFRGHVARDSGKLSPGIPG